MFCANPTSHTSYREVIEALLNQLHTMFANNKVTDPAYGAAVQAAYMALKSTGGRVVTFQTSLPATGPGKLKKREDMSLLGTPKEKTLFVPQDEFYTKLAKSCVEVRSLSLSLSLSDTIDFCT